jgi:hypothetical protein
MHYKNGREAKVGDKVLVNDNYNWPYTGLLISASPGSMSCNGQVVPLPASGRCVTIGDCLHIDDVGEKPVAQRSGQAPMTAGVGG